MQIYDTLLSCKNPRGDKQTQSRLTSLRFVSVTFYRAHVTGTTEHIKSVSPMLGGYIMDLASKSITFHKCFVIARSGKVTDKSQSSTLSIAYCLSPRGFHITNLKPRSAHLPVHCTSQAPHGSSPSVSVHFPWKYHDS